MTLPNFLIIGAPKCGSTSLYRYLGQHPDVFMSDRKEPRFFAYEGGVPAFRGPGDMHRERRTIVDLESYRRLFAPATTQRALGDASIIYLYSEGAAHRIQRYVPEAKLIAILRDPAERAHSNYLHQRRRGHEPLGDFGAALEAEPERIASGWGPFWHYAAVGRYASQLELYYQLFDRRHIRVYLYDDLVRDPLGLMRDVFEFLGVNPEFVPDVSRRHLVGGEFRVAAAAKLLNSRFVRPLMSDRVRTWLGDREARYNRVRPPLDERVRSRLREQLKEDVERLAGLTGKDFSMWLRTQ